MVEQNTGNQASKGKESKIELLEAGLPVSEGNTINKLRPIGKVFNLVAMVPYLGLSKE
jgi:hypothetical protein